jgi:hypothetical protein
MAGTEIDLVPGLPVDALACRYHGSNQPQPGSLASSAAIAATATAAALNRGIVVASTTYPCPIDFDGVVLLQFGYVDGRVLNVEVGTSGCHYATNGNRTAFTPLTLLETLRARLGSDPA